LSGVRLLADKAPLGAWLSSNIFFFFFLVNCPSLRY
jgi:hypothetical protein